MVTLSIGKAHFTIGAHNAGQPESNTQEGTGFMSNLYRFAESAQALADKYADYKYNQTDWRAFRF